MEDFRSLGLAAFVLAVTVNVAGLSLDAWLALEGWETLTAFGRRNGWFAALVLMLNLVGLVGLMLHFSEFRQGH